MIGYKEGLNIYIDSLGWKHDESPVVIKETLLEKSGENAECTGTRLFLPVTFGTKLSSYVLDLYLVKYSTLTTFQETNAPLAIEIFFLL